MGGHKSSFISIGDKTADIDVELAPIIRWLWTHEIETISCCQGDIFQFAHIMFPPGQHALRFVEALLALGFKEEKVCGGCSHNYYRKIIGVDPNSWPWRWTCKWYGRHKYGDHMLVCEFPYRDIAKIISKIG